MERKTAISILRALRSRAEIFRMVIQSGRHEAFAIQLALSEVPGIEPLAFLLRPGVYTLPPALYDLLRVAYKALEAKENEHVPASPELDQFFSNLEKQLGTDEES